MFLFLVKPDLLIRCETLQCIRFAILSGHDDELVEFFTLKPHANILFLMRKDDAVPLWHMHIKIKLGLKFFQMGSS